MNGFENDNLIVVSKGKRNAKIRSITMRGLLYLYNKVPKEFSVSRTVALTYMKDLSWFLGFLEPQGNLFDMCVTVTLSLLARRIDIESADEFTIMEEMSSRMHEVLTAVMSKLSSEERKSLNKKLISAKASKALENILKAFDTKIKELESFVENLKSTRDEFAHLLQLKTSQKKHVKESKWV